MVLLQQVVEPEITVAVLKELMRRNNLESALAGRNSKKLLPLLKFLTRSVIHSDVYICQSLIRYQIFSIVRFIIKTSFASVLTAVANCLIGKL